MNKIDISAIKTDTEKREYIRERMLSVILAALNAEFGEDITRHLKYDITVCPDDDTTAEIKKNRIIVEAADTKDKDGFEVGIIAEASVSVRKWNPVYSKKDNITHSAVTLADIDEAISAAEEKAKADEAKKKANEEKRQKKTEADKKNREMRKEKRG